MIEGHKNVAYNLTGPEALSFAQVADIFSAQLGRPIRYSNPPVLKFIRQMRQRGVPMGLAVFMVIEYTATKLGKPGLVTGEVQRLLGREPATLEQFVKDHASLWQSV